MGQSWVILPDYFLRIQREQLLNDDVYTLSSSNCCCLIFKKILPLQIFSSDRYDLVSFSFGQNLSKSFFQAEDGIRDLVRSRGLGDVYKRQGTFRWRFDVTNG